MKNEDGGLETNFECPICAELFMTAVTLKCSHTLCKFCLIQWKNWHNHCPVCRTPILQEEVPTCVVDKFICQLMQKGNKHDRRRREEMQKERARLMRNMVPSVSYFYDDIMDEDTSITDIKVSEPSAQMESSFSGVYF